MSGHGDEDLEPLGGLAPEGLRVSRVEYWAKRVQITNIRDWPGDGEVFMLGHFVDDASPDPQVSKLSVTENVKKGDDLEIGEDGLALYASRPGAVPSLVQYHIQIMESDADVREMGKRLREALEDPKYRELREKVTSTIKLGRLDVALAMEFLDFSARLVARYLEANPDDQLVNHYGTLTARDLYGAEKGTRLASFDDANLWYQTFVTTDET